MTSRDFCYWLQGYFEIHGPHATLDRSQVDCVRRHLSLVFTHEIERRLGGGEVLHHGD